MPQNRFGRFLNTSGYSLVKARDRRYCLLFRKAEYEFTLDTVAPLTYLHPGGERIQPDRHLAATDMGSTPASLQLIVPKDRFLLSYLYHDSAYHHGGLYVAGPEPGGEYEYQPMLRIEADRLLRMMVRAEGGGAAIAASIYAAVRMGGWSAFRCASVS